jgi:hypothetical protein
LYWNAKLSARSRGAVVMLLTRPVLSGVSASKFGTTLKFPS